jgi:hypothetical protein
MSLGSKKKYYSSKTFFSISQLGGCGDAIEGQETHLKGKQKSRAKFEKDNNPFLLTNSPFHKGRKNMYSFCVAKMGE